MKINQLKILDKANNFYFECEFELARNETFYLSKDLLIDELSTEYKTVQLKQIREIRPLYRMPSYEYQVMDDFEGVLRLKYHGIPINWMFQNNELICMLSSYGVYFPQKEFMTTPFSIEVKSDSHKIVVDGEYDELRQVWTTHGLQQDPGTVLMMDLSKITKLENEDVVFYCDEDEKELAQKMCNEIHSILSFYQSSFQRKSLDKLKMISLNREAGLDTGAIQRRNWTIFSQILALASTQAAENECALMSMQAHELGHIWFNQADVNSWEDWMNETGAEWASLLYYYEVQKFDVLKRKFAKIMDYQKFPAIKNQEGNHAYGIHEKGVAMFAAIAMQYGLDSIRTIMQVMANLSNWNTEQLLQELKFNVEDEVIETMRQYLVLESYPVQLDSEILIHLK